MNLNIVNETKETKMELSITREKFNSFLRVIKIIENICNDCDVVNGKVRQKNNQGVSIIEMDLTSIFGNDCSFTLSQLKQKIGLLKIFEKDDSGSSDSDNNISFKDTDDSYVFRDNVSEMVFRKPTKKFLDNSFIEDQSVIAKLEGKSDDLLFEHTISSNIAKRIYNVCEGFSNDIISCKVKNNTADLYVSTVTNEHFSEVVKNITLNKIQDEKFNFAFQSFAFTMDGGDIKISTFRVDKQKVVLWKFKQEIFQIPVVISGRSDVLVSK